MSCNLCEQRWMHGIEGECVKCASEKRIAALEAALAAVRAEAKREGAVEELGELLLWGPEYRGGEVSVTLTIKEYRDEIRRRIAALEEKG